MYVCSRKREHRLEQEHADIEFEIRDIEIKPHFKRTTDDDERVQNLLMRLIEVIDERNDVVENMTRINKRSVLIRGKTRLIFFLFHGHLDLILNAEWTSCGK